MRACTTDDVYELDSCSRSEYQGNNRDATTFDPADGDPMVIRTTKGKVRGVTQKASTGKLVDAWLGIPYAQKPIGQWWSGSVDVRGSTKTRRISVE